MIPSFNGNSTSVKRILKEIKELQENKSTLFTAAPLEDNIFEWHFTIRGLRDSEFEGGVYHGRILLPEDYPLKPPDIIFSTPNGRFEIEKKICLTISSHHAETWMPSWSIRTALLALISFFPTSGDGAVASLDWSKEERRKLALKSVTFKCSKCGSNSMTALPEEDENEKIEDIPGDISLRDSKAPLKESKIDVDADVDNIDTVTESEHSMNGMEGERHQLERPVGLQEESTPGSNLMRNNSSHNLLKHILDIVQVFLVMIFILLLNKMLRTNYAVDNHFPK